MFHAAPTLLRSAAHEIPEKDGKVLAELGFPKIKIYQNASKCLVHEKSSFVISESPEIYYQGWPLKWPWVLWKDKNLNLTTENWEILSALERLQVFITMPTIVIHSLWVRWILNFHPPNTCLKSLVSNAFISDAFKASPRGMPNTDTPHSNDSSVFKWPHIRYSTNH